MKNFKRIIKILVLFFAMYPFKTFAETGEDKTVFEELIDSLASLIRGEGGVTIRPAQEVVLDRPDQTRITIARSEPLSFYISGEGFDTYQRNRSLGTITVDEAGRVRPLTRFKFTSAAWPDALKKSFNIVDPEPEPELGAEPEKIVIQPVRAERQEKLRPAFLLDFEKRLQQARQETADRYGMTLSQYEECKESIRYNTQSTLGRSALKNNCPFRGARGKKIKKCFMGNTMRNFVRLKCQIALYPKKVAKELGMTTTELFACKSSLIREFTFLGEKIRTRFSDKCGDKKAKACILEQDGRRLVVSRDCLKALDPERYDIPYRRSVPISML